METPGQDLFKYIYYIVKMFIYINKLNKSFWEKNKFFHLKI